MNTKTLNLIAAVSLFYFPLEAMNVPESGLVAFYPFSGDAGDSSGNANHGTVSGAILAPDRFGNPDAAYFFNGSSEIRIPPLENAPHLFKGDFTISFWEKSIDDSRMYAFSIEPQSGWRQNLNFEFNDASGCWVYWNSGGANRIRIGTKGQYTSADMERWHHILLRRKAQVGKLELFIDGVMVGKSYFGETNDIASDSAQIHLGANILRPENGWKGELDDVAFYNRFLEISDIQQLFPTASAFTLGFVGHIQPPDGIAHSPRSRTGISDSSLIAFYPFDGDPSDAGRNAYHGTASGAVPAQDRFGTDSTAFSFDGRTGITIPPFSESPAFYHDDFSISFWEKSQHPEKMLAFGIDSGYGQGTLFRLDFNDVDGISAEWNAGYEEAKGGRKGQHVTVGSARWRHVLVRRDRERGVLELLIDGEVEAEAAFPDSGLMALDSSRLHIGVLDSSGGWIGELDDFAFYSRAITDGEARILAGDGLVAFYPFDNGPFDVSGNGNDAIVLGASLVSGRSGEAQGAYHFSGKDALCLPHPKDVPDLFNHDFTISFWERSYSNSRMYALSVEPGTGWEENLNIEFNDIFGFWTYWNGGGYPMIRGSCLGCYTEGDWHHVVLRRTKSLAMLELFINGKLVGNSQDSSASIASNAANIFMGRNPLDTLNKFGWKGELDDVAIFSRALTDGELETAPYGDDIILTSPNGGETWAAGSKHYLTWRSRPSQTVNLEYSPDKGNTWMPLADSVGWNSRYLWEVPDLVSDACLIRVTSNSTSATTESRRTFSIIPSQEDTAYKWTSVPQHPDSSYRAVDGAAGVTLNGETLILGGWNSSWDGPWTTADIWRSTDGSTWDLASLSSQTSWERRHSHGLVVHDDKIWILGGDISSGHYQADIWSSTNGTSWNLVSDTLPWLNRILHMNFAHEGKMWIMGGQKYGESPLSLYDTEYGKEGFFNDVWNSPDGMNWVRVAERAPWAQRGMMIGSPEFQGKMWVLGGGTYGTTNHPARTFFQDVWNTSDGVDWRRVTEFAPWSSRQYHNVAVYDGKLWVIAGYNPDHNTERLGMNDTWYSSDGVNWYEVRKSAGSLWKERHAATVFLRDDALWLTGGIYNDMWKISR